MATETLTPTLTEERRTAPRRQPAYGTICPLKAEDGSDLGLGLVWNISTSGISMLLNRRVLPGMTVTGELRSPLGNASLPVQLRVAHVMQLQTGDYMLGGQFSEPLEAADLRPFLGRIYA